MEVLADGRLVLIIPALCPMFPSTVLLLLDSAGWLLLADDGIRSSCPSDELVPSFNAAAYDVTLTFLMAGVGMLADALLPVRDACFFIALLELFEGTLALLLLRAGVDRSDALLPVAATIGTDDSDDGAGAVVAAALLLPDVPVALFPEEE